MCIRDRDEPRKDYSGLIADIKKNGLQKPVILRKSEKEDEFQLVDGFHRCKALEQAGMLEVRADVYEMSLAQASEYRKGHRDKPLMPVPGKLVPYPCLLYTSTLRRTLVAGANIAGFKRVAEAMMEQGVF